MGVSWRLRIWRRFRRSCSSISEGKWRELGYGLLRRTNTYLASIWCVETTKQEIGRDLRAITGAGRRHSAAMGAVTTVFSVFPDQLDLKDNGRIFAARNWMVLGFERPVNRRIVTLA